MRTLGEFKALKQAILDRVASHPKVRSLLDADPFHGMLPNPARIEITCHWDQSLSLVLTEPIFGDGQVGPIRLKQILAELLPSVHIFGAEHKRAMSAVVMYTTVHFSVPEETQGAQQGSPIASNF